LSDTVTTIRIDSFAEAAEVWESGLCHGMATSTMRPPPRQGEPLNVVFDLRFARRTLRASGIVSHADATTTAIWIQQVPDELKQLCTEEPATPVEPARPAGARPRRKPLTETVHRVVRPPRSERAEEDVRRRKKLSKAPTIPPPLPAKPPRSFKVPRTAESRAPAAPAPPQPVPPAAVAGGPGIPVPHPTRPSRHGIVLFSAEAAAGPLHPHLLRIAAEKLDGVAVYESGDVRAWLWFTAGAPVSYRCGPDGPGAPLLETLARQKAISQAVAEHADRLADVTGSDPLTVLQRLGLVETGQLINLHVAWLGQVAEQLLAQETGTLRFFQLPEIPRLLGPGRLELPALVWRHAADEVAGLDESRLLGHLTGMRRMFASVTETGQRVLSTLPLQDEQRRFVDLLHRPDRPVRNLLRRKVLGKREAAELLMTLRQLGVLSLSPHEPESRDEVELERQLRDVFERMDRDHFGFLDLHWSALPEELDECCGRLEGRVREFSGLASSITNFDAMRDALRARIGEIRRLSGDAEARCDYRASFVSEDERGMAAVTYLEQGEVALHNDDAEDASLAFRRVLEIDPGDLSSIDRVQRATFVLEALQRGETPPAAD